MISDEENLYALVTVYAWWERFMRAQNDFISARLKLYAVELSYARSQQFLRAETELCALTAVYTR